MKYNKLPFIPYRNYGLNMSCNLLISFLTMYKETNVSNEYLSEKLVLSSRQIKRNIGELIELKILIVEYPSSRTRIMRLNYEVIDKIVEGHFVQDEGHHVPQVGDNLSTMGDTMSPMSDAMSPMSDAMSPYNKSYNKLDKKSHLEIHYKK